MSRRRKSTLASPSPSQLTDNHAEFTTKPHRLHRSKSLPDNLGDKIEYDRLKHRHFDSGFFDSDRPKSVSFHPEIVLINAVTDCDEDEVRTILQDNQIDINYQMSSGMSILHYAASTGSYDCLRLLIDAGAKVNVLDNQRRSPLDLAVRNGFFDCASELIKNGAKIENIVKGGTFW